MNIYLTRHGQTEWNIESKLQGWGDSPLTEKGVSDAKLLGNRLKDIDFDIIYCSTSKRAIHTADIIKGHRNIEVKKDNDLREINVGIWQGRHLEEIKKENPEQHYNYWYKPHLYTPCNEGESFEELQKRSIKIIEEIIEEDKYKNILIVSHGITLKVITTYFQNKPLEKLWDPPFMEGTSLSLIQIENNNITVPYYGDISHLK